MRVDASHVKRHIKIIKTTDPQLPTMQQHAKTEWFNHTHMPAIAIFPLASIPFTEITHTVFQKVTSAIEEKKEGCDGLSRVGDSESSLSTKA